MNILEAIQSGKKFRRPNQGWYNYKYDGPIHIADIRADDWMIGEKTVPITYNQFKEACIKIATIYKSQCANEILILPIASELGLLGDE